MGARTYSFKFRHKLVACLLFALTFLSGIYLLIQAFEEHATNKLGSWCYTHCLLSGFMFLTSIIIFYGIVLLLSMKIKFLNGKIFIQKLSKSQTISYQMVEDISIQKSGCNIYLKDGKKIHIPSEFNNFEDIKLKLKKFHNESNTLQPYLGTQQVFVVRKNKKR